ncbi:DUF4145 domain-containing protein [Streptococcus macacae]|uniref:DUF4145 domain-containing protein n=1 Tax=Streptococcus macacae NCTC 11558 TaxID=764298 RepID=G5JU59_9STRE|nr:DUF4145 domain-containing protein [Streptococcus macacae]EHJ51651.1 hypothetical protein STRMA_0600 [Streptococcus macacae NCTC 11558]SUN78424.1 Uncharacterised protein [Streptococcus macacae NCTC 11558]
MVIDIQETSPKRKENFDSKLLGYNTPMNSKGLICPYCSSLASHRWISRELDFDPNPQTIKEEKNPNITTYILQAKCLACNKISIWIKTINTSHNIFNDTDKSEFEKLIYPQKTMEEIPLPSLDMPQTICSLYLEARAILGKSPKAAAALSRLAIEELLKYLGNKENSLDENINALLTKGLPKEVKEMLIKAQVLGDEAIAPGKINSHDNKELALSLLKLLNFIVNNQISQNKEIQTISSILLNSLSEPMIEIHQQQILDAKELK